MRDRMNRKRNPVLHTHLTHQLGYVRLYRALFESEHEPDFLVGSTRNQELENFFLPIREGNASRWENAARRRSYAVDEDRHHPPGRPHRILINHPNRLDEFSRAGSFVDIAFCARSQGFQDRLIIRPAAGNNNAQIRSDSLQSSHQIKEVLPTSAAEQYQIHVLTID